MGDTRALVWTRHWRGGRGGGTSFGAPDDVSEVEHTSDDQGMRAEG